MKLGDRLPVEADMTDDLLALPGSACDFEGDDDPIDGEPVGFHNEWFMSNFLMAFTDPLGERIADAWIEVEGSDEGAYDPQRIADPSAVLHEDIVGIAEYAEGLYEKLTTKVDDLDGCVCSPEQATDYVEMVEIYRTILGWASEEIVRIPTVAGQRVFLVKLYDALSEGELPHLADVKAFAAWAGEANPD